MPGPITIDRLTIAGFRAFLEEQSFTLYESKRPKSLAVFAPNAKGKSSLVDAIEYYFSEDGTLERLGQRQFGTKAGPDALRHVNARKREIISAVTMEFREGAEKFGQTRTLTKAGMANVPAAATRIIDKCNTPFIIRGYELRRFVEETSSQARYEDVSRWLMLSPLLKIQKDLRELRLKLNNRIQDDPALTERLTDLKRITSFKIKQWDDQAVLNWVSEIYVEPLDKDLTLPTLDEECEEYKTLTERNKQEDEKVGLTTITAAIDAIATLYEKDSEQEDGTIKDIGATIDFEEAVAALSAAVEKEMEEKAAAENAVFKDVWENAEKLLSDNEDLSECPVCDTPFINSPHGDQEAITIKIKTDLNNLKAYSDADAALKKAKQNVTRLHTLLRTKLSTAATMLKAAGYDEKSEITKQLKTYRDAIGEKFSGPLPDSKTIKTSLNKEHDDLEKKKEKIEEEQGDVTYAKALEIIDKLIALKEQLAFLQKKNNELEKIQASLKATERFIARALRNYLKKLIDKLQGRMASIYKAVQPDPSEVPSIRFELDAKSKQPQLHLLVDFAPNRKGVTPSGYLRDSQLHTLALSLRIAAIEKANENVPIIVLDDIVTSYDADHRKAIAALLAAELPDAEIIIATHDELFYRYLEDHLPKNSWQFKRIKTLDEDFGPRFHDHMVTDEMIKAKWKSGDSAANEIRQAEEEWLTKKAIEFSVYVRIREVQRVHEYDRGELAIAIYKFLKSSKVAIPEVKGIKNPFFLSLQKGTVENIGSHFSINPLILKSEGDEKIRWSEFQEFCGLFICKCGSKKFKRPKIGMKRAVCDKCEKPFSFVIEEEKDEAY